jgi:pimeloyl-ACP methyl ester carboxylesterase
MLALGLAVATVSLVGARQPSATAVDPSLLPYASTKDSARLADGRMLHLVCAGQGSPTVILTAGRGGWAVDWNRVQPAIAAKTRVCAWDRAGFGLSGPSPVPQTVDATTADLAAALKARGLYGPYIMVGHSMGSYESLLMADRYPSAVAGMVLVDPSLPDQFVLMEKVAPAIAALAERDKRLTAYLAKCAAALRAGTVRPGGADPDGCLRPPPPPPTYPEPLRVAFLQAIAQSGGDGLATIVSYMSSSERSAKIVVNPRRHYGAMPLIVLTAGDYAPDPGMSAAAVAEIPAFQAAFRAGHKAYAALSTRGVQRTVPGTTHYIQQIKPQVVIDAIAEVVDEARAAPHSRAAR